MFASRFFVLALGAVSIFASPVSVQKRDVTDVLAVATTLQNSAATILPQIQSLVSSGTASDANLTPLIAQLTTAVNTAQTSFGSLSPVSDASDEDNARVANVLGPVIREIIIVLNSVEHLVPDVARLLISLNIAINALVRGLDRVLIGAVILVDHILNDVSGLLVGLGFTLGGLLGGLLGIL